MADNIELELETQLASQHEALEGINEAINLGGDNPAEGHAELLQVHSVYYVWRLVPAIHPNCKGARPLRVLIRLSDAGRAAGRSVGDGVCPPGDKARQDSPAAGSSRYRPHQRDLRHQTPMATTTATDNSSSCHSHGQSLHAFWRQRPAR